MSQSNVRHPEDPAASTDAAALRAQFDAEVLAADLTVPAPDRAQLFIMWAEHRPVRARLRATEVALAEEPSFMQKPAQAGAGVTLPTSTRDTSSNQGGPA